MTMSPPAQEKMDLIKKDVLTALKAGAPAVAAFDADGTLWKTDMGENFFQYKIENRLVRLPADPWAHYEMLKKRSHPEAYLWLAQILEGQSLEQTRHWAKQALRKFEKGVPVFPWMQDLIQFLKSEGVAVYIVTASIKWAVEPAAETVGLNYDDVIGIETEVLSGVVTSAQKGIITYREGKTEALLARTGGKAPVLAAGNTMGDFALLQSAQVRFANVSDLPHEGNYATETELLLHAKNSGWHWHKS